MGIVFNLNSSMSQIGDEAANKLAFLKLMAQSNSTSIEAPSASASTTSLGTIVQASTSSTNFCLGIDTTHKVDQSHYKAITDATFPTIRELRKLTLIEIRVSYHLEFMTECLEKKHNPTGSSTKCQTRLPQNTRLPSYTL